MLEVGYGAGPYYGIFSLKETAEELEYSIKNIKEDENLEISPAKPFPFGEKDIISLNQRLAKGEKSIYAHTPLLEATFPCNGCIPICHQGCTYWTFLVVTGELRGSVWDAGCFEGYEGYWIPTGFSSKINSHFKTEEKYFNLSFEDWIERWIEDQNKFATSFFTVIFHFITRILRRI